MEILQQEAFFNKFYKLFCFVLNNKKRKNKIQFTKLGLRTFKSKNIQLYTNSKIYFFYLLLNFLFVGWIVLLLFLM